jgi:hypothetical protein
MGGHENRINIQEKKMIKKIVPLGLALGAAFTLGAMVTPQDGPPPVDVGDRHGNMRDAQQLIRQAWLKVDTAQQDNNYNLGGHAGRAKNLLSQASSEIKQAAEDANHNH